MSGRGNCYDNAQAESFFSRFKIELIEGGIFEDIEQACLEIFSYIEGYYNRVRSHSSLSNKSPMEFKAEARGYITFNPAPIWEKVKVPVLALWGAQDSVVPAEKVNPLLKTPSRKEKTKLTH